ncbi:hypothetical protein JM16_007320 [Phytophthora kernoviae]|uniref:Uncharacterized protein n=1 Tax=Phytophthora kernoviae TaxID=325452 RepID=A0A8T0LQF6_9STRA|nr:hypothetical protein JM16_007320 [Phytophthora kernoviae]
MRYLMKWLVKRGDACYLIYQYPVEVFGVFMALRLYLLARFVRSASALYSPWISLVGSLNGLDAMRPFFHFKAIFKLHPLNVLLPLTLLNTMITAAIVRVLERPVQAAFDNYWKAIWFTIVTLLFARMRAARKLRLEKPTIELSIEDQVAEMEATVLAEVERLEAQKVDILERIQTKAEQLADLKEILEMKKRAS